MKLQLSPELNAHFEKRITDNVSLNISRDKFLSHVARAVLQLSDFYIANPNAPTPWNERYCQLAYEFYYFPLNYLRARAVYWRGKQVGFFNHVKSITEFGSGNGAATVALLEGTRGNEIDFMEASDFAAQSMLSNINDFLAHQRVKSTRIRELPNNGNTLLMSYSLTELAHLPKNAQHFENLIIIEPGTSDDGRKLLKVRKEILQQGFSIWAPCTHQEDCPLLELTAKDWCHDRLVFEKPPWFEMIEKSLPIKNNTLVWSYLLASKRKAPDLSQSARVTGDRVEQKGKSLQLICRGKAKESLSWLHRKNEPQEIPRGALLSTASLPPSLGPQSFGASATEIRVVDKIPWQEEAP